MIRYSVLSAIVLVSSVATVGCRDGSEVSQTTGSSVVDAPDHRAENHNKLHSESNKVDPKDRAFLDFGKYFAVEEHASTSFSSPHELVAHAVWKCSQGQTKELLLQMPHVETDAGLGEAFVTFLEVFGPDLEQFRDSTLKLKFHAYKLNDDTSVWYYYLFTADGNQLEHSPWVSAHRSRSTGRCALTGIFLYDPEIGKPGAIPGGLVTSE